MGEEKKEAEEKKNEGGETNEKKEEEKKNGEEKEKDKEEEKPQEIVMKVDMHCEACARKVAKSLKGFEGVEDVTVDCKASKVVAKGKTADPLKVCERIQKKTGRKVELISPIPKPPEEQNKEEPKEEPKQEEKKEEPPAVVTIVLKIGMHCEACAQVLQKRIRKIPGVESATADLASEQVTVKGVVDPTQLVNDVYKRTKKQASIVKDEEKKEEGKKDEEKKDEKEGEKKDGEDGKTEDDTKLDIKKSDYFPPKYYSEYAYPPQFFSDENPNACSVM